MVMCRHEGCQNFSSSQIQSMARMWKARKAYVERKQFFKDHVSALLFIWNFPTQHL